MPDGRFSIMDLDDDVTFRRLWADPSNKVADIAQLFGWSEWKVNDVRRRLGLPSRVVRKFVTSPPKVAVRAPQSEPPPEPRAALAHPDFPLERDAALMATGGKYAALERLAKRWGLPVSRVAARWHLVRV